MMQNFDWSQCPEVEAVPGKLCGAWVLRNTRMPVAAILDNTTGGATIEELLDWYDGLDRRQVRAVLAFATGNRPSLARSAGKCPSSSTTKLSPV